MGPCCASVASTACKCAGGWTGSFGVEGKATRHRKHRLQHAAGRHSWDALRAACRCAERLPFGPLGHEASQSARRDELIVPHLFLTNSLTCRILGISEWGRRSCGRWAHRGRSLPWGTAEQAQPADLACIPPGWTSFYHGGSTPSWCTCCIASACRQERVKPRLGATWCWGCMVLDRWEITAR